jgi:hypothetical protein
VPPPGCSRDGSREEDYFLFSGKALELNRIHATQVSP